MRHLLVPSSLLLRAAIGLTAFALIAGACGDGKATVEEPTSTSTPYLTPTPEATNTPMPTATPERRYVPPSVDIPQKNRKYFASVVDLADVLFLCNGTEEGHNVANYFMEKGAQVTAPVGGRIINLGKGADATTVVNFIEIEYAPDAAIMVNFFGTASEGLTGGDSISEGAILGTIGDGVVNCVNSDTNLLVYYYPRAIENEQSDIYVDEAGNVFVP